MKQKKEKIFCVSKKPLYICTRNSTGALAQLVEQRTENPCVPGSIPGGTTIKTLSKNSLGFFNFKCLIFLKLYIAYIINWCLSSVGRAKD